MMMKNLLIVIFNDIFDRENVDLDMETVTLSFIRNKTYDLFYFL